MATVLDSLLVRLGFDSSQVSAGLSQVNSQLTNTGATAQRTGGQLHGAGTQGAAGFASLARSAGKFLALIGGTLAIKHFIQQTTESNAALDRLSKNLGESVQGISTLSNAAELAGGTSGGLQETLKMLSMEQTKYKLTGESGILQFLNYLGLSLDPAMDKLELFMQVSDRLKARTGGDRAEAFNIGRMMGVDEGTLNLMLKSKAEIQSLMRPGNALTATQARNASKLAEALKDLGQAEQAVGNIFVSDATPAMLGFVGAVKSVLTFLKANSGIVEKFFTVLAVGAAIAGAALALAFLPVTLWTVGITALAAGIALLWDDFEKWQKGAKHLIPWDDWRKDIEAALDWIDRLWEKIKDFRVFGEGGIFKTDSTPGAQSLKDSFVPDASPLGYINRTNNYSNGGNRSVENNIGEIKIYTKSNDEAREIAGSINYLLTSQANSGLS